MIISNTALKLHNFIHRDLCMHKNELKSEANYTMNMNPHSIIPVSLKSLKLEILTYIYSALVLKFYKLNELLIKQMKKRNDRKSKTEVFANALEFGTFFFHISFVIFS